MTAPDNGRQPDSGVHLGRTGVENERRSGLEALFEPRGIAVIGASASPGKLGAAMARSLESFPGPVMLINSRRPDPAAGMHPSVAAAVEATGSPVDLAVLCVPASATAGALAEAAAAGAGAALVCAGGFAEAGGRGLELPGRRRRGRRRYGHPTPRAEHVRFPGPGPGAGRELRSRGCEHPGREREPGRRQRRNPARDGLPARGSRRGLHLGVGIGNGLDVTAADVLDHLAGLGPMTPALL